MRTYRLAIIGFGNVGQGLAQILNEQGDLLRQQFGVNVRITAVSDIRLGSVYHPAGLAPQTLLDAVRLEKSLRRVDALHRGWDSDRTIRGTETNVVVELSPTDLTTGEPAISHIRAAFETGKHAITTNKGPVALQYRALAKLAADHGVELGLEGTVMSGSPALRLGSELLSGARVESIQGVINGTTNYILTQMQEGKPYSAAIEEAQDQGYAEADPTGDVEGYDAAGKLVILANVLMGAEIGMEDVEREGITRLTKKDVAAAKDAGEVWKLVARVDRTGDGVRASVRPQRLPHTHPLASVHGAANAITFATRLLGDVTLIGPGAGRLETAYAILCDLLAIDRHIRR
ncbi:MAG: homoserine dehydrogenase [Anaerolineales bacterium]|nr:homoserine dehydrogenase [Anaerolineales bacterium]